MGMGLKIRVTRDWIFKRIPRALVVAFGMGALGAALGACVTPTGAQTHGATRNASAQEARATSLTAPPSLELTRFDPSAEGVEIALPEGTAAPMAKLLQRSIATAFGRYNVPASYSPGGGRYLLSGQAGPNRDPDQPSAVAIEWKIFDRRQGREASRFTLPVIGDHFAWEHGDPRVIAQIGEDTSRRFVGIVDGTRPVAVSHGPAELAGSMLARVAAEPSDRVYGRSKEPPGAGTPAAARPVAPPSVPTKKGPKVFLTHVGGAPGDGDAALAQAARAAFVVGGLGAAAGREDAQYIVAGAVKVAAPAGGRQQVRIIWEVSAPDGRPLGRAVQENAVPEGSLDGAWGPTAAMVAGAAVAGITNVIRRAQDTAARNAPAETADRRLKIPPTQAAGATAVPPSSLARTDTATGDVAPGLLSLPRVPVLAKPAAPGEARPPG